MTKRSCVEIAGSRARHARERARTGVGPFSPLRGEIAFAVFWLTSLMTSLLMAPFRARPAPRPEPVYQPTPQEFGVPGPLRHRPRGSLHGRYCAPPSMSRIFRDLKRPAAHDAARTALMARVGSDTDTLAWVAGLVDAGTEWRLALHARPGRFDAEVVEAWRAEARAERVAAEAEARATLMAKVATANAAEGNETGEVGLRPPGF